MRPRPYSTQKYLTDISAALRTKWIYNSSNWGSISSKWVILALGWLAFFGLIFWLVGLVPSPDLHERALIDPANPHLGDVKYYQNHFWYWAIVDGKGQWVDP